MVRIDFRLKIFETKLKTIPETKWKKLHGSVVDSLLNRFSHSFLLPLSNLLVIPVHREHIHVQGGGHLTIMTLCYEWTVTVPTHLCDREKLKLEFSSFLHSYKKRARKCKVSTHHCVVASE